MTKLQNLTILTALLFGVFIAIACQTNSVSSEEQLKSAKTIPVEPTPEKATNNEPITIAAGGDMMMGSPVPNAGRMPPNDGKDLLKPVAPIFQAADIAFGNLEGPLIDNGISPKCGRGRPNCYAFRMPTRYANYLKEAGFDVMSIANNHAGDFGAKGRLTTRQTLDELGIKHAGGDSGRYSTAYLDVKGKKVAFIGFATNSISLNVNDIAAAKQAVQQADKQADIVVVSFHGGAEGTSAARVPNKTEIFFGERRGNLPLFSKAVIDAGADVVIGHGPHVLRGMEIYKDRLIAYSLGNFATYGQFRLAGGTAETLVLEVKIDAEGKFLSGQIHPFVLRDRGIITVDNTNSATKTIRQLSQMDFPNSAPKIADDGSITK
jgi:poly-gamma-glutamate capsule biosynthesis protein CapA/YwtB (metallophosphatase superfamily)